ncbi:MAG: hypothetical protein GY898_04035 [Proteobacteria bacterium]|nr:hypothetical protein [Pseudomonadota bacterium]
MLPRLIVLSVLLLPATTFAQEIGVEPYLQLASPTAIHVMWESDSETDASVEYGLTEALGTTVTAGNDAGSFGHYHHRAELTGLTPATRYHYRVTSGSTSSDIHDFITPAEASAEADLRIVAMSDMQQDWQNTHVFEEVTNEGVIDFTTEEWSDDLAAELNAVMVPGDLVTTGPSYDEWPDTFFTPGQNLFHHVPLYPVPGNHEGDSANFFNFFHLPGNEHWWGHSVGNVRMIGLDSNGGYRTQEQLDFLEGELEDACADADIDFVFAQLHHPHKSELWLAGETAWSGDAIALLEAFSTDCGKPSLHFFGHTHGYSRGQSRDHRHVMVNVATAGGNIDYWGEYAQADYDQFVISQDEWGFVMMEVSAGDAPSFRLRRVSRGNENLARDNEVRDLLTVRTNNDPPATPEALSPADGETAPDLSPLLVASTYSDPDTDLHGGSHFQVSADCADWSDPMAEAWIQHINEYGGVDLQAGDDLADTVIEGLLPGMEVCWRVRYRDQGLAWSDWSAPAGFRTAGDALTKNLLLNPGAEDGIEHWSITSGTLESVTGGECEGVEPRSGGRYFAIGGLCADESETASAVQRVEVDAYAKAIDDERATAFIAGWFRDFSGDDLPEVEVIAIDAKGAKIASSGRHGEPIATWTQLTDELPLPPGTRSLDFLMHGTRFAGTDNDSYLDDLELRLAITPLPDPGDDDDSAGDDDDDDDDDSASDVEGCSCGSSIGGSGSAGWLLVLVLLGRRRRG